MTKDRNTLLPPLIEHSNKIPSKKEMELLKNVKFNPNSSYFTFTEKNDYTFDKKEIIIFDMLYERYKFFSKFKITTELCVECEYDHIKNLLETVKNNTSNNFSNKKMLRWLGFSYCIINKRKFYSLLEIFESTDYIDSTLDICLNFLSKVELHNFYKKLNKMPKHFRYNHFILGYIQGLAIFYCKTSVSEERNFTRKYLQQY